MADLAREDFTEARVDEKPLIDGLVAAHGMWGEHYEYTQERWRQQVANRDTLLGYWHWVARMMQATKPT